MTDAASPGFVASQENQQEAPVDYRLLGRLCGLS